MGRHAVDDTPPDTEEILSQARELGIEQQWTGNDDEIDARTAVDSYVLPEHLADQPLGAVPLDRPSELFRGDYTEAGVWASAWLQQDCEVAAVQAYAAGKNAVKLVPTTNPPAPRVCPRDSAA